MIREILAEKTGVMVVDYQEKLGAAMHQEVLQQGVKNTRNILTLAELMNIPVICTEQYPRGLGPTIEALGALTPSPVPKTTFSAYRTPEIEQGVKDSGRTQWIVVGMETHICVYQTVRDLIRQGHEVWVPQDASVSRKKSDWMIGVDLMRASSAQITSTEAVLFDLLKDGKGLSLIHI